MAAKSLSQKQIAERLGISSATVSLVLRDPDTNRASSETKQRIFQYASASKRRPRTSSQAKATTVLFVMRGDEKRFFFQQSMLHGAQEQAAKMDLKLEVVNGRQDFQTLANATYIKGVLLETPTLVKADAGQLSKYFRTVTMNAHYHGEALGLAILDDPYGGFRKAIAHAQALGHRQVGYLGFHGIPGYNDPRFWERSVAFENVCRFMGVELGPDAIQTIPSNANEGIDRSQEIGAILTRWRDSPTRPTVVFCHNDLLAARIIMVAMTVGMRVPDQLSLVGYDNEALCSMLSPGLTSICPKFAEMGRVAVTNLCNDAIWTEAETPCRMIVPATVDIRESLVGPPSI